MTTPPVAIQRDILYAIKESIGVEVTARLDDPAVGGCWRDYDCCGQCGQRSWTAGRTLRRRCRWRRQGIQRCDRGSSSGSRRVGGCLAGNAAECPGAPGGHWGMEEEMGNRADEFPPAWRAPGADSPWCTAAGRSLWLCLSLPVPVPASLPVPMLVPAFVAVAVSMPASVSVCQCLCGTVYVSLSVRMHVWCVSWTPHHGSFCEMKRILTTHVHKYTHNNAQTTRKLCISFFLSFSLSHSHKYTFTHTCTNTQAHKHTSTHSLEQTHTPTHAND